MRRAVIAVGLAIAALATTTAQARPHATEITMWSGQTDTAQKTLKALAAEYGKLHPGVSVRVELGAPTDNMRTKLQAALSGDSYPDIAYVYGSELPDVAQAEQVADITKDIPSGFDWKGLYPAGRVVSTVKGRIVGFPAAIDALAVLYNRTLFAAKGVPTPTATWSWDDYRRIARRVSDGKAGIVGAAYPVSGTEDTTWRLWPMLWQQGGSILDRSGRRAMFATPAAASSLRLLAGMAKDGSMVLDQSADSSKMYGLFKSKKLAMLTAGSWAVGDAREAKIDYGVQVLPGYGGDHETVSGQDVWTVFEHGDDARRKAATGFLAYITAPEQNLRYDLATGNLPLGAATTKLAGYRTFLKRYPGTGTFVRNLANARRIRPATPKYASLSQAVAKTIQRVLQAGGDPQKELASAARSVDKLLAG